MKLKPIYAIVVLIITINLWAKEQSSFAIKDLKLYQFNDVGQSLGSFAIGSITTPESIAKIHFENATLEKNTASKTIGKLNIDSGIYDYNTKVSALVGYLMQCIIGCLVKANSDNSILNLVSDYAEIKDGTFVYSGNVKLHYEDLHLTADSLTIYLDNKQLEKIYVEGSPIHIKDTTSLEASANTLTFVEKTQLLAMHGTPVKLTHNGNKFSGNKIDYDVSNKKVLIKQHIPLYH